MSVVFQYYSDLVVSVRSRHFSQNINSLARGGETIENPQRV